MGKRAALIAGLAAVAVITAGVLSWHEFALRFQVYRMRQSPDYLISVIDSPENTIAGQAVRRIFASKEFPGASVLQAYLEILTRANPDFTNGLGSHYDEVVFSIGSAGEFGFNGMWEEPGFATKGAGYGGGLTAQPADLSRLVAIQAFLADAHYRCSDVPNHPGAVFSFCMANEALPEATLLMFESPTRPYCFVQWPEKLRKKREDFERGGLMSIRLAATEALKKIQGE